MLWQHGVPALHKVLEPYNYWSSIKTYVVISFPHPQCGSSHRIAVRDHNSEGCLFYRDSPCVARPAATHLRAQGWVCGVALISCVSHILWKRLESFAWNLTGLPYGISKYFSEVERLYRQHKHVSESEHLVPKSFHGQKCMSCTCESEGKEC